MELKEFIKATITAIAEAIEELNVELKGKALLSPDSVDLLDTSSTNNDKLIYVESRRDNGARSGRLIQDIEFNLAITEDESTKKGGGISINVVSVGLNSKKKIENINTVKFSIPVAFLK